MLNVCLFPRVAKKHKCREQHLENVDVGFSFPAESTHASRLYRKVSVSNVEIQYRTHLKSSDESLLLSSGPAYEGTSSFTRSGLSINTSQTNATKQIIQVPGTMALSAILGVSATLGDREEPIKTMELSSVPP